METIYTVKSKKDGYKWMFVYKENGKIKTFELDNYELSVVQELWLSKNFPINETVIKNWELNLKQNFLIEKAPVDVSFKAFWDKYNYKKGEKAARIKYEKLTHFEKVKCFDALKKYDKHLQITHQAKAYLSTWLHNERFNDE
jgi:hypothetical protein